MQQQRRRNRFILGVLALGLLAGVALTASPAQAVDAAGPYYALPSWDRKMAPVNRFVVLTDWTSDATNGAVLDKETGLVWEKSSFISTNTWVDAKSVCINRTTGGRTGWRLPEVHELTSLIQPSGFIGGGPTLPPGHPFLNVQVHDYWTATTYATDTTHAWYVGFATGFVGNTAPKGNLGHFWCVRGGNNAPTY